MTNHLSALVDSYRLAIERPPPPGQILVHNQIRGAPAAYKSTRGFRAWWAKPGREFTLCACGWRPDLGQHYRVHRAGPVVRRRGIGISAKTREGSPLASRRFDRAIAKQ